MIAESRPQKEPLAHGSLYLPLMVHNFATDPTLTERISTHWHTEYELLAITEGRGEFRINDRRFPVQAGELVFVNSDEIHGLSAELGTPLSICAVVFGSAMIESPVNDAIEQKYIRALRSGELVFRDHLYGGEGWQREALARLSDLRESFAERPPCYELRLKADLYAIWYLLASHPARLAHPRVTDERDVLLTKQMLEYLQQNYAARLTLAGMAAQFHLSEGQLCRFFKAKVNLTIVEYLNYYRISRATELLQHSGDPIGVVAGQAGFDNISYFNKMFRRYMHCTPCQFRKTGGA